MWIESGKTLIPNLIHLGNVSLALKNKDQSREAFRAALRMDPKNKEAAHALELLTEKPQKS